LSETGGNSTTTQSIKIRVEYKGVGTISNDQVVQFVLSNLSAGAPNPAIVNIPVDGFSIDKKKFKTKPDTITFTVNISIDATQKLTASEFFDIHISGAPATDPYHRVMISTQSTAEAEKKKK